MWFCGKKPRDLFLFAGFLSTFCLFVASPASAPATTNQEDDREPRKSAAQKIEKILNGLEQGMAALRAIGRNEDAEHLKNIAMEVKKRRSGEREGEPRSERKEAARQIEIMGVALNALREGERRDAADLLQRAIHARRVGLEGRRDEEAHAIRERAPSIGQQAELLTMAAELYADWGHEKNAKVTAELAHKLADRARKREGRDDDNAERKEGRRQIAVMRYAMEAFLEANRPDAATRMEHAMHAMELALEGRRDKEALDIRERAPTRGEKAELLGTAAGLYREWNRGERAEVCAQLARTFAGRERGNAERKQAERKEKERQQIERQKGERQNKERQQAERNLKIMRMALDALKEARKGDPADILERATHALGMRLEGRRDEEAVVIYERAPNRQRQAIALNVAAALYKEWGSSEKAQAVASLARQMGPREKRVEAADVNQLERALHRVEKLEETVKGLQNAIEKLKKEQRADRR